MVEFRCVMALIRGLNGLCPCPICLVPPDKQMDLSEDYDLRTASKSEGLIKKASEMTLASDKEALLKIYGLRPVKVRIITVHLIVCVICRPECILACQLFRCPFSSQLGSPACISWRLIRKAHMARSSKTPQRSRTFCSQTG
jgi:hypothetical protein